MQRTHLGTGCRTLRRKQTVNTWAACLCYSMGHLCYSCKSDQCYHTASILAFCPFGPPTPHKCVRPPPPSPPLANTHMNLLTYRHTLSLAHTHTPRARPKSGDHQVTTEGHPCTQPRSAPPVPSLRARALPPTPCLYVHVCTCVHRCGDTDR